MVCWNFMKLHNLIHLIEKLSNYILFFLEVVFNLQQFFNWTNLTAFSFNFGSSYIWCSFFLQIVVNLLIFILSIGNYSRLWHWELVPYRFTFILKFLQNYLNHFLIFFTTLLSNDALINYLHLLLDLPAWKIMLISMFISRLFR